MEDEVPLTNNQRKLAIMLSNFRLHDLPKTYDSIFLLKDLGDRAYDFLVGRDGRCEYAVSASRANGIRIWFFCQAYPIVRDPILIWDISKLS